MSQRSSTIGVGVVGTGFVAPHHIDAIRRLGGAEVVGLAGSSLKKAERKADELGIPRAYGSYQELIADPDIHVIHNVTPNHLDRYPDVEAYARAKARIFSNAAHQLLNRDDVMTLAMRRPA